MKKYTFLYVPKKRTFTFPHFKKLKFPLKKMWSVDVPHDQLFLKLLLGLFVITIPYTGVLMFIYFIK